MPTSDTWPARVADALLNAKQAAALDRRPFGRAEIIVIVSTMHAELLTDLASSPAAPQAKGKAPSKAEEIYEAYPRHVGKKAALAAIERQIKAVGAPVLLEKTKEYAAAVALWPARDKPQYIPHPATWYNRGSHTDDPKEWERRETSKPGWNE